ncbi:MAG: apolipoprotein N-acyltransferase [Euzebyaceae bacterium]|nr:apolipoprotein N-acyltransferase [Euzebyaceae bacterium]
MRGQVWRRGALAVLGGALLYLGHPPADLAWTGVLALVPLLLLARDLADGRRPARRGAGWGLLAGVAFFGPLLSWILRFGVVPFALLTLLQAAAVAAFVAFLSRWGGRPGRPAVAVVAWVALEAVRGSWPLGGFPWGGLGYTQHDGGLLLPAARSVGVLGVSAACAAIAVCVEEGGWRVWRSWPAFRAAGPRGDVRADVLFGALRTPLLSGLGILVLSVLLAGEPPAPTGRTLDIAAVQGTNIRSTSAAGVMRVSTDRIIRVAEQMVLATRPLAADPPELTIWPENSLDADVTDERNATVRALVSEALDLLGGAPLLANGALAGPRPATFLNAMLQVAPDGTVVDAYVKRRPVPFAEYIPGRRWLDWFPPLDQIPSDALPGAEPGVFSVAGTRVGTVICFENIFPELVHSQVREGAQLLVVSTNNTSFGRSAMSSQHLAFSQVRAVETGRWVLHAGISGISGIVDPEGRVTQRTALFEEAIVRADLPLVEGRTLATRLGGAIGWAAVALFALALAWLVVDRRRGRTPPRPGLR